MGLLRPNKYGIFMFSKTNGDFRFVVFSNCAIFAPNNGAKESIQYGNERICNL